MSLHVGGRGPGHLVRTGAFYPSALVALDFQLQEYRTGAGSYYIRDLSALVGWSFTRTSTQTALNSSGAVVSFASGVPAITDLGLLIEEARTNLLLWSQDISNASWTKTDITVGASIAAPDGTITAALATAAAAGTDTLASNSATITASSTNTISVHLKKSGSQWLRLVFADATGTDGFNQWVDLTNGVLGTSTLRGSGTRTGATIQALINGWYRVTLTGVASTRTSLGLSVVSASADGSTTRVSGATYYPWGAGLEAGSFATSYILTTSTAVTRAADVASIAGLSLTQPLTLFASGISAAGPRVSGDNRIATLEGTGTGNVGLGRAGAIASRATVDDGATSASIFGANWNNSTQAKIAARVTNSGSAMSFAGGAAGTSAQGTSQTLTKLNLSGFSGDVTALWNGYTQRIVIYPTALSDTQLQALTQ